MLDAASDALSFAEEATREDLDTDRKLVMAVLKCVEILGEAAGRTGEKIENSADWDATQHKHYFREIEQWQRRHYSPAPDVARARATICT